MTPFEASYKAGVQPFPLVSTIIPVYEAANRISETLQSVFCQTFCDFEIIVINDGSPDTNQLEDVIRPFLKHIVYLKQENHGPGSARNLGIMRSRGQFVAFLDSDDCWFPDYLEMQMRMFEAAPSLDLVFSDALLCSVHGTSRKTFMEECPSRGPVTFESILAQDSQLITSGTVARKETIIEAGMFDETLRCSEDYDLWLRVAHRGGRIAFQRRVLLRRLIRPGSLSSDGITLFESGIRVLRKIEDSLELSQERRALVREKITESEARLALEYGKRDLLTGKITQATDYLTKANEFFKSAKLWTVIVALQAAPRLAVRGVRWWRQALSLMSSRT